MALGIRLWSGSPPASLRPFGSISYRYLFVGTGLTMTGYFMQQVANGWLVYDLTSSPTWLGVVSFASGFPMLVLSLPAGVLIDRFDRRKVLMVAQGLTAGVGVTVAALVATRLIQPWHVVIAAFVAGCLFVLISPTRQALIPATVLPNEVGAAVPWMSTAQNSGRVVGPALSGMLIAAFGAAVSFSVQASGFCWRWSARA
ncbi:MAG TPA: MFS transporter [Chloroflexota bacterium]|nr:MFS transporter [Chloroflexota bacterium]